MAQRKQSKTATANKTRRAAKAFKEALRAAKDNETLTKVQKAILKAGGVLVAQFGHRARKPPCGSPTGGTRTQSLVFSKTKHAKDKPKWTKARAKTWAKSKGYRYGKVDETLNELRLRQFDPGPCQYRSVPFGKSGIRAIVEVPSTRKHVTRAVNEELLKPRRRS